MRMLEPSTSISLRHVQLCKTMWRRCIQVTCNNILNIFFSITHNIGLKTFNWSCFRTLLSVTNWNIFALGGNAQNRIKCKKKSVVMIMLPHCAVNFFNKKANDYAGPCQCWHACLGLLTPGVDWPVLFLVFRLHWTLRGTAAGVFA